MPTINEFFGRYTRDGLVGVSTDDVYVDYIAWSMAADRAIVTRSVLTRAVCHKFKLRTKRVCKHGVRTQVFTIGGRYVDHP